MQQQYNAHHWTEYKITPSVGPSVGEQGCGHTFGPIFATSEPQVVPNILKKKGFTQSNRK